MTNAPGLRSHLTLVLSTILHAFTHAYATMLVPLYLLMVADLHLGGVKQASLLVSLYTFVYCAGSYVAGVWADRLNRKFLLGAGLLGNATAILLIGLTRRYDLLLVWVALAGVSGTIFHPAAAALVPSHYPKTPAMAIGLLGIGSGIGFFFGPQYAGWRAQVAHWSWSGMQIAQWQKPCVELGIAGIVMGVIFLLLARESGRHSIHLAEAPFERGMVRQVLMIGGFLGCRDFAAVAGMSLAGIYLPRALHFDTKNTGTILGTMMLLGVIVNPLLVWLTPGSRRLLGLRLMLVLGGIFAAIVPYFPAAWALPVLCAFQTCQMGSYAISDSAMLERLPADLRGRGYGMYFSVAGVMGSAGPWLMGWWTDALKTHADVQSGYFLPFGLLGASMVMATFAAPIVNRLGPAIHKIEPITETGAGLGPAVGGGTLI